MILPTPGHTGDRLARAMRLTVDRCLLVALVCPLSHQWACLLPPPCCCGFGARCRHRWEILQSFTEQWLVWSPTPQRGHDSAGCLLVFADGAVCDDKAAWTLLNGHAVSSHFYHTCRGCLPPGGVTHYFHGIVRSFGATWSGSSSVQPSPPRNGILEWSMQKGVSLCKLNRDNPTRAV